MKITAYHVIHRIKSRKKRVYVDMEKIPNGDKRDGILIEPTEG